MSASAPTRFRWVLTWALPVLAALVTLAVAWPTAILELGVGPGVAPALGLAAALPVAAVGVRPVPAWALSTVGAVIVAATLGPFPGHPWPFAVMHGIALVGLFVVVVLRARPPVAVGATVVTALVFGVGMHSASGLVWALVIVPGIAGLGWLVRQLGVSRRRLAASEETSERERARRAMLEERARIARELHDVVAHAMSMIVVRTETAPYRLSGLSDEVREELTAIGSAARSSLAEVRGLLGVLRTEDGAEPPRAPTPGMADVDDLLDTSRRAGMAIDVVREGESGPVDAVSALSLFRILAEALANAARHASGAPVTVVLANTATTVRVDVRNRRGHDDGPGAGLGLAGMRDRAAIVGGELTAGPTADGWQVTALLPRQVGESVATPGIVAAGGEDR